jgi:hypothetical protein
VEARVAARAAARTSRHLCAGWRLVTRLLPAPQVAARGARVVEADPLPREQQRAVEGVLGQRLRAEPLCLGRSGLGAGGAALVERNVAARIRG